MFDCHYDLLTYIYINRNNINKVKRYCNKIFNNNITGGIFNLFYMTEQEMRQELKIRKNELNVIENLEKVNMLIHKNNIILEEIEYVYGIEGLDYLEKIEDIDKIYKLGVRSVNIVWNNDNKFGGGIRGNTKNGITKLGEMLVNKLVDKGIAIDLSHANERTFYDVCDICKDLKLKNKNPIVFASHSNAKAICNIPRNLSDNQILKIKELNGIIGVVGVKPFCIKEETFDKNYKKYAKAYLEHINYIKNLLGNVNNIAVSTDNMLYYKTNKKYYKYFNIFKQEYIKQELEELLLSNGFSIEEIEKILHTNAENMLKNLNKKY